MVEDGVIKQTGVSQFEAVVDPAERVQIQSKRKSDQQQQQMAAQMSNQDSVSQIRQSEVDEILDVDLGIEWDGWL